ncbi:hypothetical protein B0T17DRAFT_250297 [Bombardia bombarda]|uniref:Uncharacterized protein n=1 Tax=Bombardia bombarda TaxID=252184 RepID=A0AA40C4Q9_9PEZI|nr:hypothetical protein B0T17DRAFT_250297 [Bombardia bombarda]
MEPTQAGYTFNPFGSRSEHTRIADLDLSVGNIDDFETDRLLALFSSSGVIGPKAMSPAEARCEAGTRSAKLLANQRTLHDILERHEATIQKRWDKKTRTQRLAVLLKAWPGMPITHRPEFKVFYKYATRINSFPVHLRGCFMWPYINQEDLCKPKALLLLLNARGRTHPSVFAAADGDVMHLGLLCLAIIPNILDGHHIVLNGVTRDADYGRLVNWDQDEDARGWMESCKQFYPGEGLLILESQDRLLEFLVECCQQILHDIPHDELVSNAYPIQTEPRLKDAKDASGLTFLTIMAEEAPYRVPEDLDLEKIEKLLAARKALAEDHVWALREDPGYFADYMYEMRDHCPKILKDVKGKPWLPVRPSPEGNIWCELIANVLLQAFTQLELFSEIHHQAQQLRKLQRQFAAQISPLEDLPEPYLAALLKFRYYLDQVVGCQLIQFARTFRASPQIRDCYVGGGPRPSTEIDTASGQLLWLLNTMWDNGEALSFCRLSNVVDELDRLIKAEPQARELISAYHVRLIGDCSIVGECMRQLEIYQPWAREFKIALSERIGAFESEFCDPNHPLQRVRGALRVSNIAAITPFGDPSDKKFEYPVGKRPTKANVSKLRAAEAHLDKFWAKTDERVRSGARSLDGTTLQRLLSQPRLLQRTPEWIEPAASAKEKTGQGVAAGADKLSEPLSGLHLGPEPPSARSEVLAAASAKTKAKTRGVASAAVTVDDNAADSQPVEHLKPRFTVDDRSLKVFRILFFDPTAGTTAGEVAWPNFLHAMQAAGFAASKLYGSVWHFQPTKPDVERSIQFHEPHPHGKIPFFVARRYGRRLHRAYGWNGDMFLPKVKAA